MISLRNFLVVLAVLLASFPCLAQQGGVSGFGGGMMGGGGRTSDTDLVNATNILTPGQPSEWALTVKEGETLVANATTTNFDPALQIVDEKGVVLAENDDIELGIQDARLLFRFPKAGAYKLLVKAFKGAGGGQFRLTMRRFVSTDIRIGARTTSASSNARGQYFRFTAEAQQTLILSLQSGTPPTVAVFSPTGEQLELSGMAGDGTRGRQPRASFRAELKGDYYARVVSTSPFALTIAAARIAPLSLGSAPSPRRLEAGGMDIWTFEGMAGDFIRVSAKAKGIRVTAQLQPRAAKDALTGDELEELEGNPKAQGELVVFVKKSGPFELTIAQPLGQAVDYVLTSTRTVPTWNTGAPRQEVLTLGGADYYLVEGKAGEILRVEGVTEQFDIALELYNRSGETLSSNDDGGKDRNALLTVLLAKTDTYLLRVRSFGFGGSGAYQLRRAPDPVRPLTIGEKETGSLGVDVSDIWSFTGKAGKTLILSVRSADFDTFVRVFGPDGIELASNDDGGDGTNSLLSFTLPLDGKYTIWVSGKAGTGKYSVRALEAEE